MGRIVCGIDFHKNECVLCALHEDGSAVMPIKTIETRMMGHITRSGSEILRRYLIHGARAWMKYAPEGDPNRSWAEKVKERRGMNQATVSLAHRMARIIFAILRDGTTYTGKPKKKQRKEVKTNNEAA